MLSMAISLGILGLMYWQLSRRGQLTQMLEIFAACDRTWMFISLAMVVPLTLLTAWRLQQLMPDTQPMRFGEANMLILAASVLNLVLPSKMGDIAKAWFMTDRGHLSGTLALSLVVFEKACDMLSLLVWCVFGLLLLPDKGLLFVAMMTAVVAMLVLGTLLIASNGFAMHCFALAGRLGSSKLKAKIDTLASSWSVMHEYFWSRRSRVVLVLGGSIFIWFLHLLQIWMFILALKASAPFVTSLALSPLAILAGLLPLTFAGVGTRDAALVAFYAPYFNAPTAAALGLLCTARYLLPAIGGLPFAGSLLAGVKRRTR